MRKPFFTWKLKCWRTSRENSLWEDFSRHKMILLSSFSFTIITNLFLIKFPSFLAAFYFLLRSLLVCPFFLFPFFFLVQKIVFPHACYFICLNDWAPLSSGYHILSLNIVLFCKGKFKLSSDLCRSKQGCGNITRRTGRGDLKSANGESVAEPE